MENFIVSARKYRPATFETVVGQSSITSTLQNAIRNNTLAQAFLFCGPRGVGKTTCARIMAKTINCLNPTPEMEACGVCESCTSFDHSASFNIYELDAASNNSVEDIRNLVDQVRIPPQVGKYKVYIIDEVHMLSQAAFNAFLKTLEEPPAYAKYILATTEKHKIIPTILSRCQIFDFKRITIDDISKHLHYVAEKEGVQAEQEALHIIAQKADGALRDALSIFDQMISFSGKNITYRDVIENLNVLDYEYYFRVTESILGGQTSEILLLLNEVIDNGFEPQHFVQGMGNHLRSLLVSKDPATVSLMEVSQQLRQRYVQQALHCNISFLLKAMDLINQCDLNYRASNNKRLLLETTLLQLCVFQETPTETPTKKLPQNKFATQAVIMPKVQTPVAPEAEKQLVKEPEQTYAKQPQETPKPTVADVQQQMPRRRTISINVVEKPQEKKEEAIEPAHTKAFSQEMLTAEWMRFAEKYKNTSPNFAMAIGRYEPILKENFEIIYKIDNRLIASETQHLGMLFEHLKNAFDNNQFKLIPEIVEKPQTDEAYTDREKFAKLSEKYPLLLTLQQQLNLEPEL
ncbi:MAG: DNA polymerase III subunit gamma/tau [Lentimicrobiaceae bacterium]|jgi:DNA polymerase-3 subunit gamma/tau|nr:DNA polymerase III subunit gamma/tau [Lentimicrobiaceae bacterium]